MIKNSLIEYINNRHKNYNISVDGIKSINIDNKCIDIEFVDMEPQDGEEDVITGYSININNYRDWLRRKKLNRLVDGIE